MMVPRTTFNAFKGELERLAGCGALQLMEKYQYSKLLGNYPSVVKEDGTFRQEGTFQEGWNFGYNAAAGEINNSGTYVLVTVPPAGEKIDLPTGKGIPRQIAQFSIRQLEGCCGIAVSYHANVVPRYRQRGIGKVLLDLRIEAAKACGYTILQATTIEDNEHEVKLLKRAGFVPVHKFNSTRTRNDITIWMKDIQHTGIFSSKPKAEQTLVAA